MCKEANEFSLRDKISCFISKITGGQVLPGNISRLTSVMLVLTSLLFSIGFILWTTYSIRAMGLDLSALNALQQTYINIFYTFSLLSLIASWLIVLLQESRSFVENELTKKNEALENEVLERKLAEEKLDFLATYDQLTQLPNRFQLDKKLRKKIDEAQRFNERFSVLFFDIDHFKSINDSLGHELGDQLLKQVATRVRAVLREYDFLSRFGGNEFVIIMPHVTDNSEVSIVADKIVQLFAEQILSCRKHYPRNIQYRH